MSDKRKAVALFSVFAAASFILFILFYVIRYLPTQNILPWYEPLEYIRGFIAEFTEFILPLACAVAAFSLSRGRRIPLLLYTLLFSAARFFYLFLYYYLYWTAYGNDWIESSLLSLAVSLAGIAVFAVRVLLLSVIIYLIASLTLAARKAAELPPKTRDNLSGKEKRDMLFSCGKMIPAHLGAGGVFDLSAPVSRGIFVAVFIEFVYGLVLEIIDSVNYLVEYAGGYAMGEIVYMMISYVMLLAELFGAHAICRIIEKKTAERAVGEELNGKKDV